MDFFATKLANFISFRNNKIKKVKYDYTPMVASAHHDFTTQS